MRFELREHEADPLPVQIAPPRIGWCDQAPLGVSLYPGMRVIDARRDGANAVRIVLADPMTGIAGWIARCESVWDESGASPQPSVACAAPLPLLSAF